MIRTRTITKSRCLLFLLLALITLSLPIRAENLEVQVRVLDNIQIDVIEDNRYGQWNPQVRGKWVTWKEERDLEENWYAMDIGSREKFDLPISPHVNYHLLIGDFLVFSPYDLGGSANFLDHTLTAYDLQNKRTVDFGALLAEKGMAKVGLAVEAGLPPEQYFIVGQVNYKSAVDVTRIKVAYLSFEEGSTNFILKEWDTVSDTLELHPFELSSLKNANKRRFTYYPPYLLFELDSRIETAPEGAYLVVNYQTGKSSVLSLLNLVGISQEGWALLSDAGDVTKVVDIEAERFLRIYDSVVVDKSYPGVSLVNDIVFTPWTGALYDIGANRRFKPEGVMPVGISLAMFDGNHIVWVDNKSLHKYPIYPGLNTDLVLGTLNFKYHRIPPNDSMLIQVQSFRQEGINIGEPDIPEVSVAIENLGCSRDNQCVDGVCNENTGECIDCVADEDCVEPETRETRRVCSEDNKELFEEDATGERYCHQVTHKCLTRPSVSRVMVEDCSKQNTLCHEGKCGCPRGWAECWTVNRCLPTKATTDGEPAYCDFQCKSFFLQGGVCVTPLALGLTAGKTSLIVGEESTLVTLSLDNSLNQALNVNLPIILDSGLEVTGSSGSQVGSNIYKYVVDVAEKGNAAQVIQVSCNEPGEKTLQAIVNVDTGERSLTYNKSLTISCLEPAPESFISRLLAFFAKLFWR